MQITPVIIGGALLLLVLLAGSQSVSAYQALASEIVVTRNVYVRKAALDYGLPLERIYAIILQESKNNSDAVGKSGERGLMQVTEGALVDFNRRYGSRKTVFGIPTGYTFDDLFDPEYGIDAGSGYLAMLRDQLDGDLDSATQAYNVGMSNFVLDRREGLAYLESVKGFESLFT